METSKKRWLRAKDVAEYLSCGLSTVWHYASIGKLTPKKISARVTIFDINEIDALINSAVEV